MPAIIKVSELETALAVWATPPLSHILHHGNSCCESARHWLLGMDDAQRAGAPPLTGPRWIRGLYRWGPSAWPIHWCEAVREKILDCGALAWMTREMMRARGVACHLIQTVQRYSEETTAHWAASWDAAGHRPGWVRGGLVYHELCAVAMPDGALRLWDPSAGWWLEESVRSGYGSLAALRLVDVDGELADRELFWARQVVTPGVWNVLP